MAKHHLLINILRDFCMMDVKNRDRLEDTIYDSSHLTDDARDDLLSYDWSTYDLLDGWLACRFEQAARKYKVGGARQKLPFKWIQYALRDSGSESKETLAFKMRNWYHLEHFAMYEAEWTPYRPKIREIQLPFGAYFAHAAKQTEKHSPSLTRLLEIMSRYCDRKASFKRTHEFLAGLPLEEVRSKKTPRQVFYRGKLPLARSRHPVNVEALVQKPHVDGRDIVRVELSAYIDREHRL